MEDIPIYKVLVLGIGEIGKTSLIYRYAENRVYNPLNPMTTDFKLKELSVDNRKIKLNIIDSKGQENRLHNTEKKFYKGAEGIILLYDITNFDSFFKIPDYIEQIKKYGDEKCVLVLVGNKSDLSERIITKEESKRLAEEHSIPSFECSSVTGEGLDDIFNYLAKSLSEKDKNKTDKGGVVFKQKFVFKKEKPPKYHRCLIY